MTDQELYAWIQQHPQEYNKRYAGKPFRELTYQEILTLKYIASVDNRVASRPSKASVWECPLSVQDGTYEPCTDCDFDGFQYCVMQAKSMTI